MVGTRAHCGMKKGRKSARFRSLSPRTSNASSFLPSTIFLFLFPSPLAFPADQEFSLTYPLERVDVSPRGPLDAQRTGELRKSRSGKRGNQKISALHGCFSIQNLAFSYNMYKNRNRQYQDKEVERQEEEKRSIFREEPRKESAYQSS